MYSLWFKYVGLLGIVCVNEYISYQSKFAYDTMIFCKAMALDAAALMRVLDLYAIALGQVKLREVFHEI